MKRTAVNKLAAAALTAIATLAMTAPVTAQEKAKLRVGYLPILDHLTLPVSHSRDNANYKHVTVEPTKFKAWPLIVGAMKSKNIEATYILAPLALDLYASDPDLEVVLLAHRNGSAITVKNAGDIKKGADLKGKRIAVPDNKSTHLALLGKYLADHGLTLSDVTVSVVPPPFMEDSMKAGAIDAFIAAEPAGAKAVESGTGRILVLTNNILNNHVDCVVIVRKSFAEKHRAAVQEWVKSLVDAGNFIEQDKAKTGSSLVAKIAEDPAYMGIPSALTVYALQNPRDKINYGNLDPVVADVGTLEGLAIKAGMLKKTDLGAFVDRSFFAAGQ